ncbi:MAG: DMT family transporter [Muribaculaceae bacterium]|nr:DMT family transporter [Muribaculaceae bacterium]
MSLFIDKNGWLGAAKRKIGIRQYAGLLLIAAGVALLRLN